MKDESELVHTHLYLKQTQAADRLTNHCKDICSNPHVITL